MLFQAACYVLFAYVLGSIPFGKLIAGRVARIDITQRGSGNIGATNVARELDLRWGLLTLALDLLKGLIPVALFIGFASAEGAEREIGLTAVGLAALIGHQFSLFLKFRGGKGVATALGVYLTLSPLSCLGALILFISVVVKWNFVSLGSMISATAMPLLLYLLGRSQTIILGSAITAGLICLKHSENIQRLIRGEERKWHDRKNHPSSSNSLSSSSSE